MPVTLPDSQPILLMIDPIDIARNSILAPAGLDDLDLDRLLGLLAGSDLDAADIYFQKSRLQSWVLEDGIIKDGNFSIEQGVGVRAISGEKTGFAYSDELEYQALVEAAEAARAIARTGGRGRVQIGRIPVAQQFYAPIDPLLSLPDESKVELLKRVDAEARRQDPRVKQVTASVVAVQDTVLVLTDDGTLAADVRPLVRLNVSVICEDKGRRESYAHLPMPRMTNTYMLAGTRDPQEIIASVERGLYAVNFGGGQVDITSGKFVFSTSEAYLIEGGKIGRPVKGATLIGNGPDVLTRVSLIGNDLALDTGVGTCGKEGQSVPVGVGQPTLRIDGLTVGGTSSE